ncbi:MAG TPA: hypothetical protein VM165_11095, partial [Planctomycetaceae bacterium]|nr:hypothetical protein [Planctomycetaceae bacterium]
MPRFKFVAAFAGLVALVLSVGGSAFANQKEDKEDKKGNDAPKRPQVQQQTPQRAPNRPESRPSAPQVTQPKPNNPPSGGSSIRNQIQQQVPQRQPQQPQVQPRSNPPSNPSGGARNLPNLPNRDLPNLPNRGGQAPNAGNLPRPDRAPTLPPAKDRSAPDLDRLRDRQPNTSGVNPGAPRLPSNDGNADQQLRQRLQQQAETLRQQQGGNRPGNANLPDSRGDGLRERVETLK